MCGIAGVYFFNQADADKQAPSTKVLELLRHRGPDHQAFRANKGSHLYHSRLSIIDTSAASHQPFAATSAPQSLVFNGEIFNYRELASRLETLQTQGDVEVLYKLLCAQGLSCLTQLNGFFAFGFYDEQTHRLLVARDRFGVKPLYYYRDSHKLAFASELKPLLELIGPQPINQSALYSYLRLNYCAGNETIFQQVYRLLPGQSLDVHHHQVEINNWYQAPNTKESTQLFPLLNDAVKLRLQADVPVGTFLSGGIDSSIISALAIRHKPDLHTFSVGFDQEHYFDETRYSEMVAKHIGSNHHVLRLKEEDFLGQLPAFLNALDEPFADSSAFNFYTLSKYTSKFVKVALSGDGADELFKGYHKHRALLLSRHAGYRMAAQLLRPFQNFGGGSRHGKFKNALRQIRKFGELQNLNDIEAIQHLACISSDSQVSRLLLNGKDDQVFKNLFHVYAPFGKLSLEDSFDLHTVLADDMLVKADRFSMQHGLEIRNPFLDYRVVEYAMQLDLSQKINSREQKRILRESFGALLPDEIFTRKKRGFELPLEKWLRHVLSQQNAHQYLQPEKIRAQGFLQADEVLRLQTQLFSANAGDSAAQLWAILVWQAWMENFKDYIQTTA